MIEPKINLKELNMSLNEDLPRIMQRREVYKPFLYEKYEVISLNQHNSHWSHTEVPMAGDIHDFKHNLNDIERNILGSVLKGFTQAEINIACAWADKVRKWFPHPEIQDMATTFACFEGIHQRAYSNIDESIGLDDYEAFLDDPETKAKLDNLILSESNTPRDVAVSMATFSAFGEGVLLFSSFAVLLSFCLANRMKGLRMIIAWSVRDESQHSDAGCELFNDLINERPDIWDDNLKNKIYDAARLAIKLEDEFIDKVFSSGDLKIVGKRNLKEFIRFRANDRLIKLNLYPIWRDLDEDILDSMEWFDELVSGATNSDFFASKSSNYARGIDWSTMFNGDLD